MKQENTEAAAKILENAGFETSIITVNLGSRDDIIALVEHSQIIMAINDMLKAYQYSKRCNVLRVMYEAVRWGKRGAKINSISPGIIITPLANDELYGPRGDEL
ncbi:MAG: hypothetical protein IJU48_05535 [Synergistaceae bacterium]|nr:hypothetical protein [Synergistaceae bacterium]